VYVTVEVESAGHSPEHIALEVIQMMVSVRLRAIRSTLVAVGRQPIGQPCARSRATPGPALAGDFYRGPAAARRLETAMADSSAASSGNETVHHGSVWLA
jgi:hypothetical protein